MTDVIRLSDLGDEEMRQVSVHPRDRMETTFVED
jgi:hypothetical protein